MYFISSASVTIIARANKNRPIWIAEARPEACNWDMGRGSTAPWDWWRFGRKYESYNVWGRLSKTVHEVHEMCSRDVTAHYCMFFFRFSNKFWNIIEVKFVNWISSLLTLDFSRYPPESELNSFLKYSSNPVGIASENGWHRDGMKIRVLFKSHVREHLRMTQRNLLTHLLLNSRQ